MLISPLLEAVSSACAGDKHRGYRGMTDNVGGEPPGPEGSLGQAGPGDTDFRIEKIDIRGDGEAALVVSTFEDMNFRDWHLKLSSFAVTEQIVVCGFRNMQRARATDVPVSIRYLDL